MSLESVRKRLSEATPGPWRHAEDYLRAVRTRDGTEVCNVHLSRDRIGWGNRGAVYPDGDLIAHAPTDLELMANVVEAAKKIHFPHEGPCGYVGRHCACHHASERVSENGCVVLAALDAFEAAS